MRLRKKTLNRSKQAGLTLIELMIAMMVLAIGLAGIMAIVVAALYGNARNRTDTTATLLSQMVIEQMANTPANAPVGTKFQIKDCAGVPWNVSLDPGGVTLRGTNSPPAWVKTDIDFSVASPAGATPGNGYAMSYQACNTNGSPGLIYDVRWNIQSTGGGFTKTVVVATRVKGTASTAAGGGQNIFFAIPVQLKTILGS